MYGKDHVSPHGTFASVPEEYLGYRDSLLERIFDGVKINRLPPSDNVFECNMQ